MSEATELADAASSRDPRVGLRAVLALRRLLETLEAVQVSNARDQGWSWQEIARALDVSKQAVHKKYASRWATGRTGPTGPTGPTWPTGPTQVTRMRGRA